MQWAFEGDGKKQVAVDAKDFLSLREVLHSECKALSQILQFKTGTTNFTENVKGQLEELVAATQAWPHICVLCLFCSYNCF
jgi:hypothetical protein